MLYNSTTHGRAPLLVAREVYGEVRSGDLALLDQVLEEGRLAGLGDGPKRHADETVVRLLVKLVRLVVHGPECLTFDAQPGDRNDIRRDSARDSAGSLFIIREVVRSGFIRWGAKRR
jgi:hypothetical protein